MTDINSSLVVLLETVHAVMFDGESDSDDDTPMRLTTAHSSTGITPNRQFTGRQIMMMMMRPCVLANGHTGARVRYTNIEHISMAMK